METQLIGYAGICNWPSGEIVDSVVAVGWHSIPQLPNKVVWQDVQAYIRQA